MSSTTRAPPRPPTVTAVLYDRVLAVDARPIGDAGTRPVPALEGSRARMAYYACSQPRLLPARRGWTASPRFDSPLGHQPDRRADPGRRDLDGSLGHGLPLAVGWRWACAHGADEAARLLPARRRGARRGLQPRGDRVAGRVALDTLTAIVVDNDLRQLRLARRGRAAVRGRGLVDGDHRRPRPRRARARARAGRTRAAERRRREGGGSGRMRDRFVDVTVEAARRGSARRRDAGRRRRRPLRGRRRSDSRPGRQRRHPRGADDRHRRPAWRSRACGRWRTPTRRSWSTAPSSRSSSTSSTRRRAAPCWSRSAPARRRRGGADAPVAGRRRAAADAARRHHPRARAPGRGGADAAPRAGRRGPAPGQ